MADVIRYSEESVDALCASLEDMYAQMDGAARKLRNVRITRDTGGSVQIMLRPCGYAPCHNTQAVTDAAGYEKERDTNNPAGSVFVDHGTTLTVPWYEMESAIHLEKPKMNEFV